jgi:predicted RNase H-like nuclease
VAPEPPPELGDVRHLGIDLAWGQRARTGLAELAPDGRLLRSTSVVTDEEILEWVHAGPVGSAVVAAIDAPLVVVNEAGARPCEREVGRLFGRYHASAHTSNLTRPAFRPEPRGARLARACGWSLDVGVRPGPGSSVAIEVYPHPAMVSLFGLDRVIPYKGKRGRTVADRQHAMGDLADHLERVLGPTLALERSERWAHLRSAVATATRQVDLDRVEDEVDAILCAALARMWHLEPERMVVLGDTGTGALVTPLPPAR